MGGLRQARLRGTGRGVRLRGARQRGAGDPRGTVPPRGTLRQPRDEGRRRGTRGYILLDALVAMAIALIGLATFMGSLSALGRIALRQAARIHTIVDQRNADEQGRAVLFQGR